MEYHVDVLLRDRHSNEDVFKRVHAVRPLTDPQIINVPYVTESSRVNLIIPVLPDDVACAINLLDDFWRSCVETEDNSVLYFVFVYVRGEARRDANDKDVFEMLRYSVDFKYPRMMGNVVVDKRIKYHEITADSSEINQFAVIDAVLTKERTTTSPRLFMLGDCAMSISGDLLNRVRMHTIEKLIVFFPVAFWLYKPNLSQEKRPYTKFNPNRDHAHKTGHWDLNQYVHASFYSTDYKYARKLMYAAKGLNTDYDHSIDLLEMFLKFHRNIYVLRPLEPLLYQSYRPKRCHEHSKIKGQYSRCLRSKAEDLASRSQLALAVVKDLAEKQKEQLQKPKNVDQIQPDMG